MCNFIPLSNLLSLYITKIIIIKQDLRVEDIITWYELKNVGVNERGKINPSIEDKSVYSHWNILRKPCCAVYGYNEGLY